MPKARREKSRRNNREVQTPRRRRRSSSSVLTAPGTFVPYAMPTQDEVQENPRIDALIPQGPLVWQTPQVGPNDRGSDHRRIPPRSHRPPPSVPQEGYSVFPRQPGNSSLPVSTNVAPTGSVDLSSLDISSAEMSQSISPSTDFLPTPESGVFRGYLPESEVSNYQEDPHPAQQWPELQSPDSSTSHPYANDASLFANTLMAETSSDAAYFFNFGDGDIFLTPDSSSRMSTSLVMQEPDSYEFSLPSPNDET